MARPLVDRDTAFTLYCNLMSEIKARLMSFTQITQEPLVVDPRFIDEYLFLQLRKVCELVAVGCLVAHRDIEKARTGKLYETYNARTIIKALGGLHADFYPIPFKVEPFRAVDQVVHGVMQVSDMDEPYMEKAELLHLYDRECGDFLHLGTLDDLLTGRRPSVDRGMLVGWFLKFQRLLINHRIVFFNSQDELWIDMTTPGVTVSGRIMSPGKLPDDHPARRQFPR